MLPERINVIKTVTYDVSSVVEILEDMGHEDIDFDAVIEYVQDRTDEDFCSPASGIVFQDENGEEL